MKEDVLKDIISRAVKHTPTPFNSQTGRVVLVLGEKHAQLWDAVFEEYKETLDGDGESPFCQVIVADSSSLPDRTE